MNRQFLFIKSATESIALPVDSFSHSEYTSDTTISLYFDAKRSGKDASVKVVLTVTSGKAQDVMNLITGHIASSSAAVMKYDVVNSVFFSKNVTGITSITTTEGPSDLVPSGGEEGEVLTKDSATDYDVSWQDVHTLYVEVRNDSGGTLAKGTPVHATGVTGTVADVIAARADTASAMPATYVLNEEIADGAQGRAIISGTITGVDTSSFSPGDVIYVATTGGFTSVKPTGTNLIQNLGVVTKSNANTGSGVVLGSGRSNDLPNIPDGQAWIGNASGVPTATTLATVATTGSYNDLSDQPTIPTDTNLGNSDQTLSAERTVEMGGNSLVFDNSSTEVAKIFPQGYIQAKGRTIVNGNGSIGGLINLKDADSSNGVTLRCPTTVSSDLTLVLPDSDGSSGQVIQTDGSGNLSFVSNGFPKPLATLAGRFQFDADDGNRTIVIGNTSFGTNYYIWNTELFDTIGSGTVDTTTQSISNTYAGLSFRVPQTAKIRWDWQHRPVNSSGYSKEYRAQIWSVSSFGSGIGGTNWTLRADEVFTSNSTTGGWLTDTVTTTSDISEGDYVMFVVGLNNQTISATTYLSFQSTVTLTA